MRFVGQEYRGKNVLVALIDSGVDSAHPSLKSTSIEGYSLSLRATNHVAIDPNFHDEHGHGTKMALHLLRFAPEVRILAIKITDTSLRASSDLIASGIELAYKGGASVINVSMGTPNMGRAMLLRDCTLAAMEHNALVVASAHPMGQRAYPADLPEVVGVSSNKKCLGGLFHLPKRHYPRKKWKSLSDKFIAPGDFDGSYAGVSFAAARVSAYLACLKEAMPDHSCDDVLAALKNKAHWPTVELGYL
ncbi:MAG: S8 family serine peptidase [Myxococcota bacterium]|nr:S8 family serine peptidase [Myxococcota bacterium]